LCALQAYATLASRDGLDPSTYTQHADIRVEVVDYRSTVDQASSNSQLCGILKKCGKVRGPEGGHTM
jgi:hypothetical protein